MITRTELYVIMLKYLEPELDKRIDNRGFWGNFSNTEYFYWYLKYRPSNSSEYYIGFSVIKEDDDDFIIKENAELIGFDIFNTFSINKDYVNIRIRKGSVEFIEESKFEDFDRDFMYGLYEKIKEYCGGDNNGSV